jgi:hypothetical protein
MLNFSRCIALLLLPISILSAERQRAFKATEGFTQAKDLPVDFKAAVDTISYRRYDAFEGSRTNSEMEKELFKIGNKLHIISKQKTIRRRIMFKIGGEATRELLLETERRLRKEEFLAEAIIEVAQTGNNRIHVLVHTYDQFSTAPAITIQKTGDRWTYWFGLIEHNLVGSGQKIGLIYGHGIKRDYYMVDYKNKAFILNNLQLSGIGAITTDGYDYRYELALPLLSKTQTWGFSVSNYGRKYIKYIYLDADLPGQLEVRKGIKAAAGEKSRLFGQPTDLSVEIHNDTDVVDMGFTATVTRSYGLKHKLLVSPTFKWKERYQDGRHIAAPAGYELDSRNDYLAGIYISYFQRDYKTVRNFRNLKWSENLDVGFRFSSGVHKNLEFLGAGTSQLFLEHTLVYINIWKSRHFLHTSLSTGYYLGFRGDFEDGTLTHSLEYQWKPIPATSSFLSSNWKHYFAREKSTQLILGGEEGLNGYPNRFFAGQARLLIGLEQRWFPDVEFGTAVPALAVFLNAGDAFESYDEFDAEKLHYSAGLGLRIGATRSVQKVVNHINIAFPLDSKYRDLLDTWKLTVTAKGNL